MQAAFFDVDNTLIAIKSMFRFQRYYFEHAAAYRGADGESAYASFECGLRENPEGSTREILNRLYYKTFAGRRVDETRRLAGLWFAEEQRAHGSRLWIAESIALMEAVRAEGACIVLVSGSCHDILAPIVAHLRADHSLATTMHSEKGCFSGEIDGRQMIGSGKAEAVREFAAQRGLDLARCLACGDHLSDLPMLEAVGSAHVVAGDPAMEAKARENGWPILSVPAALDRHASEVGAVPRSHSNRHPGF